MKHLSLALLSLLLLTPTGTAAAQSGARGTLLAEGRPPLTTGTVNEVAEFFGWLFESRFTPAQRRELERVLVAAWRANDRKEIEAAAQFGELNAKLKTVSEGGARSCARPSCPTC